MTDEEIRELMLVAVGPPDPQDQARVVADVKARLAARDARRAAELASEDTPETTIEPTVEPSATVQPIPLPRPKAPRALLLAPVVVVGLMMAAMVLLAVAWLWHLSGGPSDPGLETPPSELPLEAGRDEEKPKR